jgi:D-3-phosphoglycerate dehydrogenase
MKVYLSHSTQTFPGYFGERALVALQAHAEVVRNATDRELRDVELAQAAAGCEVIIAYRASPGTAATFAAAPDLVAFLRCAVDISTIDVPAASSHGILVTRATPGFTDAVAELGIGFLVDLARGVTRSAGTYHRGEVPLPSTGVQLSASSLGLIGYGRIARRVAATALALGMRVMAHDPYAPPEEAGVQAVDFAEAMAADFVVCLATATPETANLIDTRAFSAMRRGAYFINLSRGELVDEAALEAALDCGHLAGAAMDVGRAPDQLPTPRLARRTDVIATPHLAGLTRQAAEHQAMDTVWQVAALAAGQMPEGAINPRDASRLEHLRQGIAMTR